MRIHSLVLAAGGIGLFACTRRPPAATEQTPQLTAIEWRLVELNGQPAGLGAGGKPATLSFAETDKRANGFGGCNRFGGTYELSGTALSFSPLLMTKMACDAGMELEQNVARALGETRNYRLAAEKLELLNDAGVVVARYQKP